MTKDMTVTAERIRAWYEKLQFPKEYDEAFEQALATIPISEDITLETYDNGEPDGKRNLLSFLYLCEHTAALYRQWGIPEDILLDSLSDIPRWTQVWSGVEGTLCLRELGWLKCTLSGKLIKLGRLQYERGEAWEAIPAYGIQKGDTVLSIHIPRGERLTPEACKASLAQARAFFATHFPEYAYQYFVCHTWLLGSELKEMLPPESNILAFQQLFDIVEQQPADDILRYTMRWNIARDEVEAFPCTNAFTREIQRRALAGEPFHVGMGVIKK